MDMKMCDNDDCTLSSTCVRYLAFPELEYQQYGDFKQKDNGDCDHYIQLAIYPGNAQEN
jgi:hypothetical protein